MATADHRRGAAPGATPRWMRAALVAVVAILAVLVHHETAAAITHVPPASASGSVSLAGMRHSTTATVPMHMDGRPTTPGATTPLASDDNGACSVTAMQHCSAAGIDTMKLAPPHQPFTGRAPGMHPGTAVGRAVAGTTGRAPPDLSVLSRFLL